MTKREWLMLLYGASIGINAVCAFASMAEGPTWFSAMTSASLVAAVWFTVSTARHAKG